MQDSLDDYIRIASNQREAKSHLSEKAFENAVKTAEYKKKCEDYAQKVVEFLIDGKLRPQVFTKSLNFINNTLYDDVVEERSIAKLCGYPLCGKSLPDMPTKKYLILTKVNKVYDITERKKYCSNFCYKASLHIKNQIDDSPLWLREADRYPKYNLLEAATTGLTPGEKIVYGVSNSTDSHTFTSVSLFTEACLDEAEELEKTTNFENVDAKFNEYENKGTVKSILKTKTKSQDETLLEGEITSNKKVMFSSMVSNNTTTCKESIQKQQEDLNESISKICSSLKINLNLVASNEKMHHEPTEKKEIEINISKMNQVIEKVNNSEKLRKTPTILIKTNADPESQCKTKSQAIEMPKYTQRILQTISKPHNLRTNNIEDEIERVKEMKIENKLKTPYDEKMKKVLNKLKEKQLNEKKGVVLIDTIHNPEVQQRLLEEEVLKEEKMNVKSTLKDCELNAIKCAFLDWFTLESYIYLYGEDTIKRILNKDKLEDYFEKMKIRELEAWQQAKYVEICKKLQMKEIAEEKFDDNKGLSRSHYLKPVPDYGHLKSEVKDMNLKVKAFYSGDLAIKQKQNIQSKTVESNVNDHECNNPAVLPLAEVTSQNAMRRNIFIKSVTKYLQKHMQELALDENVLTRIFEFVKTFKLGANNIVFRPGQWNLIALLLIYCLRKSDQKLKLILEQSDAVNYVNRCILIFPNADHFLNDINNVIDNVEVFLKHFIEQPGKN